MLSGAEIAAIVPVSDIDQAVAFYGEKLGLELQELTPELAKQLGVEGAKGVVVTQVKPDSPAAQAGLAAGDVIREVNRMPVQGLEDIEKGLARGPDGGQVLLRVERDGSQRYVVVAAG